MQLRLGCTGMLPPSALHHSCELLWEGAYTGMCGGVYGALGNPWSSRALC